MLRPVASSLPLGFLAFGAGTMLLTGACRFALTGLYEAAIGGTGLEKASGWIGHQIEQAESEPGIRRQL